MRAYAGVEGAGDQGEARGGAADTNRAVERLRRPFEARRHDPGEQPHAGEMQQRKGDAVQRLHEGQRQDRGALRHHGPAQEPCQGGNSQRPGRWQPRHEGRPDEEEHEHLRGGRL